MYIVDKFILAYFLRFHIAFLTTMIVIMIYFLFSDDYVPNLLTFFKRINVRSARWYYDHHFIFKFFSSFSSHHDQTILLFLDFWKRFTDGTSLYNKKFNRKWYYFFFCCSKACFHTIMNYENDLIDFSYNSQFFWCKQISSERLATTARLIIYI